MPSDINEIHLISNLLWDNSARQSDVFLRWCQGIKFSDFDPISLVQDQGGPCAIIAILQSYILKGLLFDDCLELSSVSKDDVHRSLFRSMASVLENIHEKFSKRRRIFVSWHGEKTHISYDSFIKGLSVLEVESVDEMEGLLFSLGDFFSKPYSILSFLYSLLMTAGYNELKENIEEDSIPLIDSTHGFANQNLINLLITGFPSQYLFDGEKNVGGMKMIGIESQPEIGFLTIFESSNYCEVGWNLKNPCYPIWILGSETHLTVICSDEQKLIIKNDNAILQMQNAEQKFKKYSASEDGSFISHDQLSTVLTEANIPFDQENLPKLIESLDSENLGIILLQQFLNHFYAKENNDNYGSQVKNFSLYHFNSLPKSNQDSVVTHRVGKSTILDPQEELESQIQNPVGFNSDIQRCLQTKWPTIRIIWENDVIPSLN